MCGGGGGGHSSNVGGGSWFVRSFGGVGASSMGGAWMLGAAAAVVLIPVGSRAGELFTREVLYGRHLTDPRAGLQMAEKEVASHKGPALPPDAWVRCLAENAA